MKNLYFKRNEEYFIFTEEFFLGQSDYIVLPNKKLAHKRGFKEISKEDYENKNTQ